MNNKQKFVLSMMISFLLLVVIGTILYSYDIREDTTIYSSVKVTKNRNKLDEVKKKVQDYKYEEALKLLKKSSSKEARDLEKSIQKKRSSLVKWDDPNKIPHLFFHSLIKDPEKAFHSKQQAQGYKDYMTTIGEFTRSIEQLYQRGYVLVSLGKLVEKGSDGELHFKGVYLPKGKQPLVLSQDDVSYYEYMKGDGFANKLIIDENGKIKNTYIDSGKKTVGDFDMIPLLDSFIRQHPDFSYQGSKGVIALTGYNGILGYRTSKSIYGNTEKTAEEIKKAKKVVKQMKKEGWEFASHSWGHIDMATSSLENVIKDNEYWQDEVALIIGKTHILIFPFGADIGSWEPYDTTNQKFTYLNDQGFYIFCNIDATHKSLGQMGKDYYRNARINVDGIRFNSVLDGQNTILDDFLNTQEVYDKKARSIE